MGSRTEELFKYFPYDTPREIQKEVILKLDQIWNETDVIVIRAPTAFGKTGLAKFLMNQFHSVSVITPTNLLVQQFLEEFPETPTLSRLDAYHCDKWDRPCPITRGKLRQFCKPCRCSSDLATAKYRRGPGIYNYHTYLAHKIYRDVLVVDEAHNLINVIKDRLALTIWQHDYKYPHNMWRPEQVLAWISTLTPQKQAHKKIQALREACKFQVPEYIFQRTTDMFNGKGTLRGEPEERDCLKLIPVDVSNAPPMFWPRDVKKIVLMSATIGEKDIEGLGLGGRRICYLNCKSPIPARNRPILSLDIASVNRNNLEFSIPLLVEAIRELASKHEGQKGVVHATYQLSRLLQDHLGNDSRYIFHDRDNKKEQYQYFRDSADDSILIACGLYEGIDLPDDLGRWQVLAKIPWMSLGNPAIAHLAKLDPEWYTWQTLKTTIQCMGRICRHPDDYGVSYILDTSFHRLMKDGLEMCPDWFIDAINAQEINSNTDKE